MFRAAELPQARDVAILCGECEAMGALDGRYVASARYAAATLRLVGGAAVRARRDASRPVRDGL